MKKSLGISSHKTNATIIGVTGGVGVGKSSVVKEFAALGAQALDADAIYRGLSTTEKNLGKKIAAVFGKDILTATGTIDRKRLGDIVFSHGRLRKKLEAITHPAILAEIKKKVTAIITKDKDAVVVVEAPLLFESGLDAAMDYVVVVRAPLKAQIERLRKKDGMNLKRIKQVIAAQLPTTQKEKKADFIIDNSQDFMSARAQVKKLWRCLTKKY